MTVLKPLSDGKKHYDMQIICTNCGHDFIEKIPFGQVCEQYRDNGGRTHVKIGWSTIDPKNIHCPVCGVDHVRKDI